VYLLCILDAYSIISLLSFCIYFVCTLYFVPCIFFTISKYLGFHSCSRRCDNSRWQPKNDILMKVQKIQKANFADDRTWTTDARLFNSLRIESFLCPNLMSLGDRMRVVNLAVKLHLIICTHSFFTLYQCICNLHCNVSGVW